MEIIKTDQAEILDILVEDLKRHDEFEESDNEQRQIWINCEQMQFYIKNHYTKNRADEDINDEIYSLWIFYIEEAWENKLKSWQMNNDFFN